MKRKLFVNSRKKKGIKEKEKTSFFCNGKKNTWKKNHLV